LTRSGIALNRILSSLAKYTFFLPHSCLTIILTTNSPFGEELSYQPADKPAYLESALRSTCEQILRGIEIIFIDNIIPEAAMHWFHADQKSDNLGLNYLKTIFDK
jgi:hypothetical protein